MQLGHALSEYVDSKLESIRSVLKTGSPSAWSVLFCTQNSKLIFVPVFSLSFVLFGLSVTHIYNATVVVQIRISTTHKIGPARLGSVSTMQIICAQSKNSILNGIISWKNQIRILRGRLYITGLLWHFTKCLTRKEIKSFYNVTGTMRKHFPAISIELCRQVLRTVCTTEESGKKRCQERVIPKAFSTNLRRT